MEYIAIGFVIVFLCYKTLIYFGRKNAIDVLCSNYKLDPTKVRALQDKDITILTVNLELFRQRGHYEALEKMANEFR